MTSPTKLDIDARVEDAVDSGLEAFWAAIVEKFPESQSGDFDPMLEGAMYADMTAYLRHWLIFNTDLIPEDIS